MEHEAVGIALLDNKLAAVGDGLKKGGIGVSFF
jgi:hypothetical protein